MPCVFACNVIFSCFRSLSIIRANLKTCLCHENRLARSFAMCLSIPQIARQLLTKLWSAKA